MRSLCRRVGFALWAYAVSVTAALVAEMVVVVFARARHDPRTKEVGSPANLRRVDDRVWAGGQPDRAQYRDLAARGIRLVVDLRIGERDDAREDDPEFLRGLGIDYVSLPVGDGSVLSPATISELVAAVDRAGGPVYVHCGGGVGRSTTAQGAYLAATGRDPRRLELLAVGPMTVEQLWFVAAGLGARGRNRAVSAISVALDAPRRLRSRVRARR